MNFLVNMKAELGEELFLAKFTYKLSLLFENVNFLKVISECTCEKSLLMFLLHHIRVEFSKFTNLSQCMHSDNDHIGTYSNDLDREL